MLEKAKLLFDSGCKWITKCYVSVRQFICKNAGRAGLLIAKILIEKLIEAFIENLL